MTDLRPRPPRILTIDYIYYAADHQRIRVWKSPIRGDWLVEDHRRDKAAGDIFPSFADAWAYVNHLLKETK